MMNRSLFPKKPLCLSLILLLLAHTLPTLGQPSFLTGGLIAYFPFDGDANDLSGYGRNGSFWKEPAWERIVSELLLRHCFSTG